MHFGIEAACEICVTYEEFNNFAESLSFCRISAFLSPGGDTKNKSNGHMKKADLGFIFPYKLMLK